MSFFNPSSFAISDPLVSALPPKAVVLPVGESIRLADRQHARLTDGSPQRIDVVSGALWITQLNVAEDIVLEAGEAAEFAEPDGVIISAIGGPAQVRTRGICTAVAA